MARNKDIVVDDSKPDIDPYSALHIVGFSGGIDSQATLRWCRNEYGDENVIAVYYDPGGHDNPLTRDFVWRYCEQIFPLHVTFPTISDLAGRASGAVVGRDQEDHMTFLDLCEFKNIFPSRMMQFCTTHLKIEPAKRFHESINTDRAICRNNGVRRDESNSRKGLPKWEWDDYFDAQLCRPLIDWTKDECFDFVSKAGEFINPLYRMGASRVGCSPCVNANKDDIRNWASRFPEEVQKIRDYEEVIGRTFFHYSVSPTKGRIDEIVRWSQTSRGGKQLELPIIESVAEKGGCASRYGLCE